MTPGSGRYALTEQIVTTLPPPRAMSSGIAARVVRTAAIRVRFRVRVPVVVGHIQETGGPRCDGADIVHDNVEPAEMGRTGYQLSGRAGAGQVDGDGKNLAGIRERHELVGDRAGAGDDLRALSDQAPE